jgi:hypothetical protein
MFVWGMFKVWDTNTLPLCPKEVIGLDVMLIPWRHFALETMMARSSRALKNLTLVYKCTYWINSLIT